MPTSPQASARSGPLPHPTLRNVPGWPRTTARSPSTGTYTGDPPPGLTAGGPSSGGGWSDQEVCAVVWSPWFRCVVRADGDRSWRVGHDQVAEFLEFAHGRARPSTVRAYAHDLKTFFAVVGKAPAEVTSRDVVDFVPGVRERLLHHGHPWGVDAEPGAARAARCALVRWSRRRRIARARRDRTRVLVGFGRRRRCVLRRRAQLRGNAGALGSRGAAATGARRRRARDVDLGAWGEDLLDQG